MVPVLDHLQAVVDLTADRLHMEVATPEERLDGQRRVQRACRPWSGVVGLGFPVKLCQTRAINPELAGETAALKDIIRARNQRRRELRATLTDRQATVEALLGPRAGAPETLPLEETESPTPPARRSGHA
jgi:hypothetical protein